MSDLVGNPDCCFRHAKAHLISCSAICIACSINPSVSCMCDSYCLLSYIVLLLMYIILWNIDHI